MKPNNPPKPPPTHDKTDAITENEVLFDFDRFDLTSEAELALTYLKATLDNLPHAHIVIEGHTDDVGTDEYNLALSKKRAQSVANWLENHAIESSRLEVNGCGKSKPKYANDSAANRGRNRRVEITIID